MKHLIKCECGFDIEISDSATERARLKALKEGMLTANLFGCPKCRNDIKVQLNALRKPQERL